MKKFFLALIFISALCQPVMAKNIKVEAMSDFSTANPPASWQVKIVEDFTNTDGFEVTAGSILEGKIENVKSPARLKRNASFTFIPVKFYDNNSHKNYTVEKELVGKYSALSDVSVGSVAKQGAVMVGNQVVNGFFGPGIALVEGAVKNEQGNRAKSAVVSAYESSPLSYINKGNELEIQKGQIFIMSFKSIKEPAEDKPNYEYTME